MITWLPPAITAEHRGAGTLSLSCWIHSNDIIQKVNYTPFTPRPVPGVKGAL